MSVRIILDIPDEIAAQLAANGQELSRSALEALALESYRLGALTQGQVGQLLSLSRIETEDFLAQHVDLYDYDPTELQREADALSSLSDNPPR
jgi:predicted HTH domain antitoxin